MSHIHRPLTELWLTRFSCTLGKDRATALISLTIVEKNNEMHIMCKHGSRTPAKFSEFAILPRSHHAHALSSVAKSSLTQLVLDI